MQARWSFLLEHSVCSRVFVTRCVKLRKAASSRFDMDATRIEAHCFSCSLSLFRRLSMALELQCKQQSAAQQSQRQWCCCLWRATKHMCMLAANGLHCHVHVFLHPNPAGLQLAYGAMCGFSVAHCPGCACSSGNKCGAWLCICLTVFMFNCCWWCCHTVDCVSQGLFAFPFWKAISMPLAAPLPATLNCLWCFLPSVASLPTSTKYLCRSLAQDSMWLARVETVPYSVLKRRVWHQGLFICRWFVESVQWLMRFHWCLCACFLCNTIFEGVCPRAPRRGGKPCCRLSSLG